MEILAEIDDFRLQFCHPTPPNCHPVGGSDHLWKTRNEVSRPQKSAFWGGYRSLSPLQILGRCWHCVCGLRDDCFIHPVCIRSNSPHSLRPLSTAYRAKPPAKIASDLAKTAFKEHSPLSQRVPNSSLSCAPFPSGAKHSQDAAHTTPSRNLALC